MKMWNSNDKDVFICDTKNKVIARRPTKSNLKKYGSDNSLYFGLATDSIVVKTVCQILSIPSLKVFKENISFKMKCGSFNVNVITNVNEEDQIQLKIQKNGLLYLLFEEWCLMKGLLESEVIDNLIIVFDFKNMEIRFNTFPEFNL